MFCSKCGKELKEGAKFCSYCGAMTVGHKMQSELVKGNMPGNIQLSGKNVTRRKRSEKMLLAVIGGGLLVCILLATGVFFVFSGIEHCRYEALVAEGKRYLNELRYEEAIIAFTKAITIEEKDPELYIGRAKAYIGLANETGLDQKAQDYYMLAEDDYKNALNEDDQLTEAYYALADVYLAQDNAENAKNILKQGYQATGDERLTARYSELDDEISEDDYHSTEENIKGGDTTSIELSALDIYREIFDSYNRLSDSEYLLIDLNGDGVQELIITSTTAAKEGMFYWLYTYAEGEVVELETFAPSYLCSDNKIYTEGPFYEWSDGGYVERFYGWGIAEIDVAENSFKETDVVIHDKYAESTNSWYYKRYYDEPDDSDIVSAIKYMTNITENEARAKIDEYKNRVISIPSCSYEMYCSSYSVKSKQKSNDIYDNPREISDKINEMTDLIFQRSSCDDYTSGTSVYSINLEGHRLENDGTGDYGYGTLRYDGNFIDDNVLWNFFSNSIDVYYTKSDGIYRASLENGTNERIINENGFIYGVYGNRYLYYSSSKYMDITASMQDLIIFDLKKGNELTYLVDVGGLTLTDQWIFAVPCYGDIGALTITQADLDGSNVKTVSEKAVDNLVIIQDILYFPEYDDTAEYPNIKTRMVKYDPETGETEVLTDFCYGLPDEITEEYAVFKTFEGEKNMVQYLN